MYPASTLTDNGMVYTVRFAGGRGGRNTFEQELHDRHVVQKNSRPGHPTTCGKVERFQQTMKKWLAAQPLQPTTIAELQALLDSFVEAYNQHRPHRSLPHRATPAALYDTMPKAVPGGVTDPDRPTTGSATTPSTKPDRSPCATAADSTTSASAEPTPEPASSCSSKTSTIRVVNAATGELLRDLTLDPSRDYQPTGAPKGPTRRPEMNNTRTCNRRSGCRRCLETSHGWQVKDSNLRRHTPTDLQSAPIGRSGNLPVPAPPTWRRDNEVGTIARPDRANPPENQEGTHMADSSFDIVSKIDRQEVDNALGQTAREIATRFDFKGTGATIEWKGEHAIEITASADDRATAVLDVFKEQAHQARAVA